MTIKGENARGEDLCDYCISVVNYTLQYLRLSHYLNTAEQKWLYGPEKFPGFPRLPILYNSEKKAKSVGCKIEDMRS